MAALRTVRRGRRAYYYLFQTYRWEGRVRRKEVYLGAAPPSDLHRTEEKLERAVWAETWFPAFDKLRRDWNRRQRSIPTPVRQGEQHDFVIEFTYHSNRIEGSSLSLHEVSALVDDNVTPESRPLADVLEARTHAQVAERLLARPEPIDLRHVLGWHREIFESSKPSIAGQLRTYDVRIRGSRVRPPPALEVRPLLLELLRWNARQLGKLHSVERAAEFHLRFERIHPFGDGNGRLGRLAMNVILAADGFPPFNITVQSRRGYLRALERVENEGRSRPFLHWFFRGYSRASRRLLPSPG